MPVYYMPEGWYVGDDQRKCWMCTQFAPHNREHRELDGECKAAEETLRQAGFPVDENYNVSMSIFVSGMCNPAKCESFEADEYVVYMGLGEDALNLCPEPLEIKKGRRVA
jgi:hypothetical protein